MAKTTVRQLAEMKERGELIPMITAYDYTTAALADAAGIPVVLVGDSLGMVVLGYESTIPVTMEDIIHHTRMVVRGNKNSLIVADLPFMTYQVEPAQALRNAARLLQEGGAHTVKLEGGESVAPTIRRIVDCDIPVMAHVGVTPQSVNAFGGYRVRGRSVAQARQIVRDALAVEAAGAYAVVLELVPAPLARFITAAAYHPHHRHWRRPGLRRPGTGAPRYAGPLHRLRSPPRQAVRQPGPDNQRGLYPIRG